MTNGDISQEPASRDRLLAAAKRLMAEGGYERTSTAAIAREAGSSESQLVRYFESKAGLLDAIFNESWALLIPRMTQVIGGAPTARAAIVKVLSAMIHMLDRDPELARLMFLEGRRVRGSAGEVLLSQGFVDFSGRIEQLVERGQSDGSFDRRMNRVAISSALLGAAEAMVRDRLLAKPAPFKESQINEVFEAIVSGLAPTRAARQPRAGAPV